MLMANNQQYLHSTYKPDLDRPQQRILERHNTTTLLICLLISTDVDHASQSTLEPRESLSARE